MEEDGKPIPPRVVERRPGLRRRVVLGGRIVFPEGAGHFDCLIRDITAQGARIALNGQPIPSRVFLIVPRDRIAHEATVTWNDGREAGLQFLRTMQLSRIADPALRFLRALCP
jgi:hypothetical protein